VAIARGTRRPPRRDNVTFVSADLATDGAGLAEAFASCDAVIHLVAVIHERGKQTFERVNHEASEHVAAAAAEAGVAHLIHQSVLGADPDPTYPYPATKWAGEQAAIGSGVPYTVLRPSLIFGPGDGFFTLLAKLIRLSLLTGLIVPVPGDGQAIFQPLAIDDLTQCMLVALERGPSNRVHEFGGPEHLTYEEILYIVKFALGAHRRFVHLPVQMMLPPAFVMQTLMRNPLVTVGQLRLLEKNNMTRLDSVDRTFGFHPQRFIDNADYLLDY
jgi:NADH dehydrogenase